MNREIVFKSMRGGPVSTEAIRRRQADAVAASLPRTSPAVIIFGDFNTGDHGAQEDRK